ncbi:hypothetical protein C8R41DRAFT_868586 [Lentinula lateritia]|uniref:Uncharacterized protein n=1 Tax=Lentinula lateritia TaxID=40482 RepID=A0ABQ8VAK0_9AGAR|nr:hypothetical protein C8R41DRAFT_868586 [Lentinula lateritia]
MFESASTSVTAGSITAKLFETVSDAGWEGAFARPFMVFFFFLAKEEDAAFPAPVARLLSRTDPICRVRSGHCLLSARCSEGRLFSSQFTHFNLCMHIGMEPSVSESSVKSASLTEASSLHTVHCKRPQRRCIYVFSLLLSPATPVAAEELAAGRADVEVVKQRSSSSFVKSSKQASVGVRVAQ